MKLSDFDGQFFRVQRDGAFDSLCNLTSNTEVKCLSFANDAQYIRKAVRLPHIACLIVPEELELPEELLSSEKGIAVASAPQYAFLSLHNTLSDTRDSRYVKPYAPTVIGKDCLIHPSAHIAESGVVIGDRVVIEENVVIREGTTIEDDAHIMVGAVIGAGACLSGEAPDGARISQSSVGRTHIGACVQIWPYACISRALFPFESTTVGAHSMIGCSVDISHNSHIGKNAVILDQSQICGNTIVKDGVRIAPHSIVSNRLMVEEGAEIAIGSVVVNNVKKGMRVAGNYAIENSKFLLWHREKMKMKIK